MLVERMERTTVSDAGEMLSNISIIGCGDREISGVLTGVI